MIWDLDRCLDTAGAPITPFHYFVSPTSGFQLPNLCSFPRFLQLPLEIQLEVCRFCNLSTLYRLVQTSSHMRALAKKLLLSELQQIWYHVEISSTNTGGYIKQELARALHCPQFASIITKIELSVRFADWQILGATESFTTVDKARRFWRHVQDLFPLVKEVVLSGIMDDILVNGTPPDSADRSPVSNYPLIETYIRESPPHLVPLIALVNRSGNPYQLWRVTAKSGSKQAFWTLVQPSWDPKRAIIPVRKLSPGLLRDTVRRRRDQWFWNLERKGVSKLRRESHIRYAPSTGIDCCNSTCNVTVSTPEEWEEHVASRCPVLFGLHKMPLSRYTPDDVVMVLESRRARIDRLYDSSQRLREDLREKWGNPISERRQQIYKLLPELFKKQNLYLPEQGFTSTSLEFIHQMYTRRLESLNQET
ncbi:hypothetical protein BJX64DRAFT_253827 [Aspergillus heterothallicus]